MYEGIFKTILYITLFCISALMVAELVAGRIVTEGFTSIGAMTPQTTFWSTFAAPRGDVGPDEEDPDYVRDPRYFNGYADVTRIGAAYDFCRMVSKRGSTDLFFACALSGTDNLQSASFRTATVNNGFRISKDDYMRDIDGDGRADYCRILRAADATYQPLCLRVGDSRFDGRDVVDPSPPEEIAQLLRFYEGCEMWYRFDRTLEDSVARTQVQIAGGMKINEMPKANEAIEGLSFDGKQYLRVYDEAGLSLGTKVPIRSIRTWMVWVYFDEFTNNAKIFDFGNGPNADNVFLGIFGKGDFGVSATNESTVVPTSGQQLVAETTPQRLMETTDANVNDFVCKGIEVFPTLLPHSTVQPASPSTKASLIYEVWEKKSRKMRIMINNIIPLKEWTHIAITTDSADAFRPALNVLVNGEKVYTKGDGCLPSTGLMTNCYLGKSNWRHSSSLLTNKDELFKGRLFDFRAYSIPVTPDFVQESAVWGKEKLGLRPEP